MHVDIRDCPRNKSIAEYLSSKVGVYVKVADTIIRNDRPVFRLLIDPEISEDSLTSLQYLTINDSHGPYHLGWIEAIIAPVVDNVPHKSKQTLYLRLTYL
jgi:hypothetical protein